MAGLARRVAGQTSHRVATPSRSPTARRRPSGLNAEQYRYVPADSGGGASVRIFSPVAASQIVTVSSRLGAAIRRPSGLYARHATEDVGPPRVRISWPVTGSHTRT